jgi:hypothetical protein
MFTRNLRRSRTARSVTALVVTVSVLIGALQIGISNVTASDASHGIALLGGTNEVLGPAVAR